jgi:hypothetical protein
MWSSVNLHRAGGRGKVASRQHWASALDYAMRAVAPARRQISAAGRSVLCLTRLRCYRALNFSGQNPEVLREPAEQLSLRRVRRQISDQLALGCLDAKLLQVHFHILHGTPQTNRDAAPALNRQPRAFPCTSAQSLVRNLSVKFHAKQKYGSGKKNSPRALNAKNAIGGTRRSGSNLRSPRRAYLIAPSAAP